MLTFTSLGPANWYDNGWIRARDTDRSLTTVWTNRSQLTVLYFHYTIQTPGSYWPDRFKNSYLLERWWFNFIDSVVRTRVTSRKMEIGSRRTLYCRSSSFATTQGMWYRMQMCIRDSHNAAFNTPKVCLTFVISKTFLIRVQLSHPCSRLYIWL